MSMKPKQPIVEILSSDKSFCKDLSEVWMETFTPSQFEHQVQGWVAEVQITKEERRHYFTAKTSNGIHYIFTVNTHLYQFRPAKFFQTKKILAKRGIEIVSYNHYIFDNSMIKSLSKNKLCAYIGLLLAERDEMVATACMRINTFGEFVMKEFPNNFVDL